MSKYITTKRKENEKLKRKVASGIMLKLLLIGTLNIVLTQWLITDAPTLPVLTVDPTSIVDPTLDLGSSFYINVTVDNAVNLWGYGVLLSFDPDVLTATSYTSYDPFTEAWPSEIGYDYVTINYAMPLGEKTGVTGSAPLARIDFFVVGEGISDLDLHDTTLIDVDGLSVPHEVVDGYFESGGGVPPTTTISLSGDLGDRSWFTSEVIVTLSATDDTDVNKTEYSFDNTMWITYSTPFIVTEEGYITIYYRSTDIGGNVEAANTISIKVDTTAPTGTILINNDDVYTNSSSVALALSADDVTSGVARMRLSQDNVTWTPWEAYSACKDWTPTEGDGLKTVYIQYVDNAGLVSQLYSDTIISDTTIPTISMFLPLDDSEIKSSTITVTWSGSDATSGISHYEIRLDDNSWINVGTNTLHIFTGVGDGSHIVDVKATDKAGMSKQSTVNFTVNTSPLFGPGYIEEAAITATIVTAVLGTAVYLLKFRKKS